MLCDTIVAINDLAIIDERAKKLMIQFWPGALTLILNSSKSHYEKTGQLKIAVRIPNHQSALSLIKKNGPLLTTSVSLDHEPLLNMQTIKAEFKEKVDYIYEEYNAFYLNMKSTTVDLTNQQIDYIRIGTITQEQIETVLGLDFQI